MSAGMEGTLKNLNLKTNLKNLSTKKKLYLAGAVICLLLFVVSIFQIISHYANAHKAEDEFAQLAEIVEQPGFRWARL